MIHFSDQERVSIQGKCNHIIAVTESTSENEIPEPYPNFPEKEWDFEHVYFPFNEKNVKFTNGVQTKKWNIIIDALRSEINNSKDLKSCILKCHETHSNNPTYFTSFDRYFENNPEDKNKRLFEKIIPLMIKNLIELTECTLTSSIPLLKQQTGNFDASITLSQFQIFIILINSFFCTFPEHLFSKQLTNINFTPVYSGNRFNESSNVEKIKCLMNYFRRVMMYDKHKLNLVTYFRRSINKKNMPMWNLSDHTLTNLEVYSTKKIEDHDYTLQVDFANSFVGGGVIGAGLVQEEIQFITHPELIVSRLFTEKLMENEVLFVTGFEKFNNYTGYSSTFKFTGDAEDNIQTINTKFGKRKLSYMVAMDAKSFKKNKEDQYLKHNIIRDLNKCFVAFSAYPTIEKENEKLSTISTGNWGCGIYGGDQELKSLIQLLVASHCNRNLIFSTFNDENFKKSLIDMHNYLKKKSIKTKQLFMLLISYKNRQNRKSSLFTFIKDCLK